MSVRKLVGALVFAYVTAMGCGIFRPPIDPPTVATIDAVVTCDGQPAQGVFPAIDGIAAVTNADGWARVRTLPREPGKHSLKVDVPDGHACQPSAYVDFEFDGKDHIAGGDPGPYRVGLTLAPQPDVLPAGRPGIVRAEGRVLVDDAGPINALGATMFWLAWGFQHDLEKFDRNLAVLQAAGVDYVRALAAVFWLDRTVDPRDPRWRDTIAGATDRAYDRYGIRVQWTIFGGMEATPTDGDRLAVVNAVADMANARPHKVFAIEVSNEAFQNGPPVPELRALGRQLRARTKNLVALSAMGWERMCETYAGSSATLVTMHFDRDFVGDGPWRPVRQPWGFPGEYDRDCSGQLPAAFSNNEPIGPESSVNADADPARLALGYAATFIAGGGAYVFHAGPGIRGGGKEDLDRGRSPDFDKLPNKDAIFGALAAAKRYTSTITAGCARVNGHWENAPFDFRDALNDAMRVYTADCGDRFLTTFLNLRATVRAPARVSADIDVLHPATGEVLETLRVSPGQVTTFAPRDGGLVLRGRVRF